MLRNKVEIDPGRLDFNEESSINELEDKCLGFHTVQRGQGGYGEGGYMQGGGLSSSRWNHKRLHRPQGSCGGFYHRSDIFGDREHEHGKAHRYEGQSRLDTPISVDSRTSHPSSEHLEVSDPMDELDEKLVALRLLILQAGEEMKRIIQGRVARHLEINREASEKKREMKKRRREVLGEVNGRVGRPEARGEDGGSPDTSADEENVKGSGIESFADFETSMFTYRSRNGAKSYACPYEGCTMELPTLSRIKRHYIVHTKLRPFRCLNKDCSKRFSRKDNMLQHYKIHCSYSSYK